MLEAASGLSSVEIVLKAGESLPEHVQTTLLSYIDRRAQRQPLQHILGEASFMGLRFKVGPAVLIPRQETEVLVEQAVRLIYERYDGKARILDIGAGSGAICLSLLQLCPQSTATAYEISPEAAALCLTNASNLAVADRLTLQITDFLAVAEHLGEGPSNQKYDIFVSNPPYIPKHLIDSLAPEIRSYEPRLALVGLDDDGLGFYRAFAEHLPGLAAGQNSVILAEFGQGQGEQIGLIFKQSDWQEVRILPDLSGIDRILWAVCPQSKKFL
jgi:release factor glutamine methyltransferase